MIRCLPDPPFVAISTMKPVVVPDRHGSSDFELFLMARRGSSPSAAAHDDVLCVSTPATRANPASDGAWQVQGQVKLEEPFNTDVAFSLQGKGFWANLLQGLMYCDDLHAAGDVVDFSFIELPPGCRRRDLEQQMGADEYNEMVMDVQMRLTRTMACVGDSVFKNFVCIDHAKQYADDVGPGTAREAVEERVGGLCQRALGVRRLQGGGVAGGAAGVPSPHCRRRPLRHAG
ncbi:hypothetical protein SEVIR_9G053701v4 [Setaria viridis]|uniref:DUF1618 domain-containing protein n=1 Tax=Setaria viridis TaxID=4556 RepID=A0A4U6SUF8_SETVI|nr:uncharacterized protein LOC117840018 [Setaria viridis]TKV90812.1 hypothetical protein SEVIR_9G053701v2 [Setaria viridis]